MMISELIISLLKNYPRVAIRKIGSFQIVIQDPLVDEKTNIISPPIEVLGLLPTQDEDAELVSTALKDGIIDSSEATDLRILLGIRALELSRNDEVFIEGVGQVTLNQNTLEFEPQILQAAHFTQYLPQVPLPEIRQPKMIHQEKEEKVMGSPEARISIEDQPAAPIVEKKQISNPKKEIPNFLEKKEVQPMEPLTKSISEEVIIDEKKIRKSSVGIKLSEKKPSLFRMYGLPLILFVLGILAIAFFFKTCLNTSDSSTMKKEVQMGFDRAPDDLDPLVQENDEIFNNPLLNKYKNILTQDMIDQGCQIVVGTFTDQSNAQNLKETLQNDGYNISLANHEDQMRVILTFDCSRLDLDEYYKKIRTSISPKAWYLVPEYEPEI